VPAPDCRVVEAAQCTDSLVVQVAGIKSYQQPKNIDVDYSADDDKKSASSPPKKGYCRLQKPRKDDNDRRNGRKRRSVYKKNNKNDERHSCQKPVKVWEDYDFKWGIIC